MLETTWKSHLVPFKAKALEQAAIKEIKNLVGPYQIQVTNISQIK